MNCTVNTLQSNSKKVPIQ